MKKAKAILVCSVTLSPGDGLDTCVAYNLQLTLTSHDKPLIVGSSSRYKALCKYYSQRVVQIQPRHYQAPGLWHINALVRPLQYRIASKIRQFNSCSSTSMTRRFLRRNAPQTFSHKWDESPTVIFRQIIWEISVSWYQGNIAGGIFQINRWNACGESLNLWRKRLRDDLCVKSSCNRY